MQEAEIVEEQSIQVFGAREHNLKNIDITIPRNKLVIITGLSGSGKSSLAFDTIYAEGQRRYIDTFSAYARQFIGNLQRPDVDKIDGLSPVISIEQKTVGRNPRSTVGTITEIYDFLRLLFARAGEAFSYKTGEKMVRFSDNEITELIINSCNNQKVNFLAPVIKGRKGHYRELFERVRKLGFNKIRVDGEILDLADPIKLDRYKIHDIEMVVDRINVSIDQEKRIYDAIKLAMKYGKGVMATFNPNKEELKFYSRSLMCPTSGIAYDDPAPNLFSFNSPYGACPKCSGLGTIPEIDIKKIIPDTKLSIKKGGIIPLAQQKSSWLNLVIEGILSKYEFNLNTPISDFSEELLDKILLGTDDIIKIKTQTGLEAVSGFEGIASFIMRHEQEAESPSGKRWAKSFMNNIVCPICNGTRLRKEAVFFQIDGKNIATLAQMGLLDLQNWFNNIETRLSERQNLIAKEVLKEIRSRLNFLLDIGLNYLTLDRSARSLSGGEAQRIRLATQIGSQLVNVLYILDEPSIGLHQRDNSRLIESLKQLRDVGNSVVVVEHDKDMMMSSDYIIDIGPGAGVHGGEIVAKGTVKEILSTNTVTSRYLRRLEKIQIPEKRRKGTGKKITLKNVSGNNLKNISVDFPLGTFICITGVSGSGKSTLINKTLYPILNQHFYKSYQKPMTYGSIKGLEHVDKVIEIDQTPIGRTPRSNPATYTGVFSHIRNLFALVPEAKIRGYKAGRFSFNVKGGRCETCQGAGVRTIEMNFLPNVYVDCHTCNGKRYNRETLDIRYKGKSIADVLNLTINKAVEFFAEIPFIFKKIKTIQDVGLGYITLGQASTTLSGGEAQRIKLSAELSKKDTGKTVYILDEPSTGLHFEDIRILLKVLNKFADHGNTVIVIEHNMDIIKVADHVIDLGPEGGNLGGTIVCEGTPEEVAQCPESHTGLYLKLELPV